MKPDFCFCPRVFSNSGLNVKLSVLYLPGSLFSPQWGLSPLHNGVGGRWRINV